MAEEAFGKSQITLKDIGLDKAEVQAIVLKDKKPHTVALAVGIASRAIPGSKTMPDGKLSNWVVLHGSFRLTNTVTGLTRNGCKLILPDVASNQIAALITPDAAAVEFAVEIVADYQKDAATSYVWGARSIMKGAKDPLAAILERIPQEKRPKLLAEK